MSRGAVNFSHVSKRFRLGDHYDSLGELLAMVFRRVVGRRINDAPRWFWALHDVGFSVAPGEAVGIIGPNGAGKSTVLKLLSRILRPDGGSVMVTGRLAGLIEVGAGFHGDLSGRENIYLNGAILGMSRHEIAAKFDEIVAFAGLESFLDMPVKRYSSGMYARLGFAIASHVQADVLLVDEVLSVGDAAFRLRCMERMRRLVAGGTTLVFVTHDLDQMQSICSRTVVLEQGRVVFSGSPSEAVGQYLRAVSRTHAERTADVAGANRDGDLVEVVTFQVVDAAGNPVAWARPREPARVDLELRLKRPLSNAIVELNLRSASGHVLLSLNSGRDEATFPAQAGSHSISVRIESLPLAAGQYFWNVRLWSEGRCELDTPFAYPMVINDAGKACGMVSVAREWVMTAGNTIAGNVASRPARTTESAAVLGLVL